MQAQPQGGCNRNPHRLAFEPFKPVEKVSEVLVDAVAIEDRNLRTVRRLLQSA
jgi:hypothetical protein